MTIAPSLVDEAGDRQIDALYRIDERRAAAQPGPGISLHEVFERRARGCERIGLVLYAADRDTTHASGISAPETGRTRDGLFTELLVDVIDRFSERITLS